MNLKREISKKWESFHGAPIGPWSIKNKVVHGKISQKFGDKLGTSVTSFVGDKLGTLVTNGLPIGIRVHQYKGHVTKKIILDKNLKCKHLNVTNTELFRVNNLD